jgi:two-component system LytT family response regulator/two-component system response regulator LytT
MKESAKNAPSVIAPAPTITAVVVDDEPLGLRELSFLLRAHSDVQIVGEARNGLEAFQQIREHEPDVIFLDVAMPGQDGLGLVRKLLDKKSEVRIPHVVFVTAYDQYAVEAFELNAIDYLLKPVEKERLAKSLQRVRRLIETPATPASPLEDLLRTLNTRAPQQTKLLVRNNNRLMLLDSADLIFASIEDGLISLVSKDLEGESNYRTIEELQANLDPATFWRVHRSFLVNINHIREVVPWFKSSYQLRMADRKNTEIPVSRAQTKRLRELFKL